jgi:hypothetical protein
MCATLIVDEIAGTTDPVTLPLALVAVLGGRDERRRAEMEELSIPLSAKSKIDGSLAPEFWATKATISAPGAMIAPSDKIELSLELIVSVYKELRSESDKRPPEDAVQEKARAEAAKVRAKKPAEGGDGRRFIGRLPTT